MGPRQFNLLPRPGLIGGRSVDRRLKMAAAAVMSFGNIPFIVPQTSAPAATPAPATVHGWMTRLQPDELEEYRSLERTISVDARTTLFRENDESEYLCRIVKGLVK